MKQDNYDLRDDLAVGVAVMLGDKWLQISVNTVC